MANSDGCSVSQKANENTENGHQADEVSDDSKGYIRELDQSLLMLQSGEESLFCPCPETLCKAEFKGDRLINLVQEIPRWHSMQDVT